METADFPDRLHVDNFSIHRLSSYLDSKICALSLYWCKFSVLTRKDNANPSIARWRVTTSASSMPYLDEWQQILEQGMEVALAKAVEDSEHAACLRRSTPFSGILTNDERLAVLNSWTFSIPENSKER